MLIKIVEIKRNRKTGYIAFKHGQIECLINQTSTVCIRLFFIFEILLLLFNVLIDA